jgi:hypothetical protein
LRVIVCKFISFVFMSSSIEVIDVSCGRRGGMGGGTAAGRVGDSMGASLLSAVGSDIAIG